MEKNHKIFLEVVVKILFCYDYVLIWSALKYLISPEIVYKRILKLLETLLL